MKKQILLLAIFVSIHFSAQIYTPNGSLGNNTNPTNNNIGIGTDSPTEMLHVNGGNMRVSYGNLQLDTSSILMDGGNFLLKGSQDVGDIIHKQQW